MPNKVKTDMNKRGEISETMTWVFATILIFILIFGFLFVVNAVAGARTLSSVPGISANLDSGIFTEEMLFALLGKKINDKTAREWIVSGNYDSLKPGMGKILDDFAYFGVKCNFAVSGDNGFSVSKGGSGKEVIVGISGREVSLKC